MTYKSSSFGSEPIPELLIKQAFPASIGILVMSLNILIDTIFIGKWIGSNAIAAINVVLPAIFFHSCLRNGNWNRRWLNHLKSAREKDLRILQLRHLETKLF